MAIRGILYPSDPAEPISAHRSTDVVIIGGIQLRKVYRRAKIVGSAEGNELKSARGIIPSGHAIPSSECFPVSTSHKFQ